MTDMETAMVAQVVEQKSRKAVAIVLDKIKAEIEQKCCITVGRENDPAVTLYDVMQIIDKHRTEVEPQQK